AEMAEDDAADRPREIAGGKGTEGNDQRDERRGIRKDGVGDVFRENSENHEIVELERAAEAGEQHDAPAANADACGVRRHRVHRGNYMRTVADQTRTSCGR